MRTMYLNQMMSKAVKCRLDHSLETYMKKEIVKVISNDQICFVEQESKNEYKSRLRKFQIENISFILKVLKDKLGIELKMFNGLNLMDEQD